MKENKAETPGALIRSHTMTWHQLSDMPQSTVSSVQEVMKEGGDTWGGLEFPGIPGQMKRHGSITMTCLLQPSYQNLPPCLCHCTELTSQCVALLLGQQASMVHVLKTAEDTPMWHFIAPWWGLGTCNAMLWDGYSLLLAQSDLIHHLATCL